MLSRWIVIFLIQGGDAKKLIDYWPIVNKNLNDSIKSIDVNWTFHGPLNGGGMLRQSFGGALLLWTWTELEIYYSFPLADFWDNHASNSFDWSLQRLFFFYVSSGRGYPKPLIARDNKNERRRRRTHEDNTYMKWYKTSVTWDRLKLISNDKDVECTRCTVVLSKYGHPTSSLSSASHSAVFPWEGEITCEYEM